MVPTIEKIIEEIDNEFYKENHYYLSRTMPEEFAKRVATKVASLHVQEALKEASEKAKVDIKKHDGFGTKVILNAYPLTNIK